MQRRQIHKTTLICRYVQGIKCGTQNRGEKESEKSKQWI